MNPAYPLYLLLLTSLAFTTLPALSQPAITTSYGQTTAKVRDMAREYQTDPRGFRARWFPKMGIPLKREDYFGVWNFFNHGTHPVKTVFDNDKSKRTYYFKDSNGLYVGHDGVDWLVSYRNFGNIALINPFPSDAVVIVTSAEDSFPDETIPNHLGNSLALTCYLDGDRNNGDSINRLVVTFSHLKQGSIDVAVGDQVHGRQALAQIGFSGSSELKIIHTHATYVHMNVKLDPFYGRYNPHLQQSMFEDQAEVLRMTNWKQHENFYHLTLDNQFYVRMPNLQTNLYVFRAAEPIAAIRVLDQNGNIVPGVNILEHPNVRNVLFREEQFSHGSFRRNVYRVSFNWYQNADQATMAREIPFLIETADGDLSNRVFVQVYETQPGQTESQ